MAPVSRWHFAGQLVLIRTDLYPSLAAKDQGGNKGARRGFCSPFVLAVKEGGSVMLRARRAFSMAARLARRFENITAGPFITRSAEAQPAFLLASVLPPE